MSVEANLVVSRAVENFQHKITSVQQRLDKALPKVAAHKHGIFCLPFCSCRRLEKQVRQDQGRVDEYQSSIAELIDNNSQPAIKILRRDAFAIRFKRYEQIGSLTGYPYAFLEYIEKQQAYKGMLKLADDLETQMPRVSG